MSAMALQNSARYEPGLFLAAVLAVLVHVIFAGFMFFGLNWKTQPPEGMIVELWHDLPPPVQPTVEQPPVKTESEQAKPEQPPVQKESPPPPPPPEQSESPPPPKITSPSPPKKPEIVRPVKKEEPKPVAEKAPAQEIQQQKELEKQREEEQAEKEAEVKRNQQEQAQQRQREQEALAAQREAQQAAERARIMEEIAKYKAMILAKVRSRIVMPPDLPGNPMAEFGVTLLPGGDILDVQLRKGSGYASFDSAVERAIFLAQPMPLPPNPALFREFRNLNIIVHYQE